MLMKAYNRAIVIGVLFTLLAAGTAFSQMPCSFSVEPRLLVFDLYGGTVDIAVTASAPTCSFTVKNPWRWINVSPTQGQGSTSVNLRVLGNDTMSHRVADVMIDGTAISVIQQAPRRPGASMEHIRPSSIL
jgi:hypothetical protein